jgi:hypothetical protein
MKLSIDRQQKSGFFGKTYYESNISLTLTIQEEEIVQKLNLKRVSLIGGPPGKNSHDEIRVLALAQVSSGNQNLTLENLVCGITAKAGSDNLLCELSTFEELLRERCKALKNQIESHVVGQQKFVGNNKHEEEF